MAHVKCMVYDPMSGWRVHAHIWASGQDILFLFSRLRVCEMMYILYLFLWSSHDDWCVGTWLNSSLWMFGACTPGRLEPQSKPQSNSNRNILKVISDSGLGGNNFMETTFHTMYRHREPAHHGETGMNGYSMYNSSLL